MVYLEDEGSRFAAPLEVVWQYLTEGTAHDGAHRSTRNGRFEPLTHSSFIYSAERLVEGTWQEESVRISVFQPVAISSVFLKGPFEGSKMVYVYKPDGRETRIDVYGDFASTTLSPERLKHAVREMLETEYAEDEPAIRRLAASR
jgi:hypothetical protein